MKLFLGKLTVNATLAARIRKVLRLDGIPLLEKRANRYAAVIFYKKALSKVRANQVNWVFSAAQKCLCQLPRRFSAVGVRSEDETQICTRVVKRNC